MKLVLLVEEPSMKVLLETMLPSILPDEWTFQVVPFSGRNDLEGNIVRKLRGWNEPDVRFVIVEDQDNADCKARKQNIERLVAEAGKPALVRIVCHELEAWFFGNFEAVAEAYGKPEVAMKHSRKRKYRNPDGIIDVKEEFRKLFPEHQQLSGAQLLAPCLNFDTNSSRSFQAFVSGVKRLCS